MADGTFAVPTRKIPLPAGRMAELRNLRFDDDMQCWTVRCGCCGEDLPCDEEFYDRVGRGPAPHCRACKSERNRDWYRRRGRALRQARRSVQVPDCPQPESPWKPIVQAGAAVTP